MTRTLTIIIIAVVIMFSHSHVMAQCIPDGVHRAPLSSPNPTDTLKQVALQVFNYCMHYHDFEAVCINQSYWGDWKDLDAANYVGISTTGIFKVNAGESAFQGGGFNPKNIIQHACSGSNNQERDVLFEEAGIFLTRLSVASQLLYNTTEIILVQPGPSTITPSVSFNDDDQFEATITMVGFIDDAGTDDPVVFLRLNDETISPGSYDYSGLPDEFDVVFDLTGATPGTWSLVTRFQHDYDNNGDGDDWFWSTNFAALTLSTPPLDNTIPRWFGQQDGVFGGR